MSSTSSCSTASSFDLSDLEDVLPKMVDETGDTARGPPSYYHVQEMNKEAIVMPPRLSRVPSQYQLESLTEVYVFDIPQLTNNCLQSVALEVNQLEEEEREPIAVYAPSEYISLD